jgi:cytochrome oxidase Cu insertion factor (SCO1/SenC/PrrC family)
MKIQRFYGHLLTVTFLLGTFCYGRAHELKKQPGAADGGPVSYRGGMVSPSLPKPKFTLTDTSNSQFDFVLKTQGSTTLLFFGYTYCPDMCPMQMHMIAQALKTLPPELANQFKVVFVTTDPDRDTPQVLRNYLDHFDKNFIGLTGTQSTVDAAQIAAQIPPAKKSAVASGRSLRCGPRLVCLGVHKRQFSPRHLSGGRERSGFCARSPAACQ